MARSSDTERYEALKSTVAEIGLIRRGTLLRRSMPCGKPGCRCQAAPPQLHGPYFQWTRKVRGKTVTVRVQPEEAELLREWIENGRRLNRIVGEMERVSDRLTERALRAVRSRDNKAGHKGRTERRTSGESPRGGKRKQPK